MKKSCFGKLAALLAVVMAEIYPISAYAAGNFGESKIAQGTLQLVNDVTSWLTLLGPLAGGLAAIWFLIRMQAADEVDQKMWKKRAITAGLCGVGTMLVSGTIALITAYYA